MDKILPRKKWKLTHLSGLPVGTWFCRDLKIDDSIYMKINPDPTFPPMMTAIVIEPGFESKTGCHTDVGEQYCFRDEEVWKIDSGADFMEHKN